MSQFQHDLTIKNDLASLALVRDEVDVAVRTGGFPEHYINRILIAVDEAVTNIIEHGYEGKATGEGKIEIHIEVDPDLFTIAITDQGEYFDPRKMTDVDLARHVAAGKNGGLGVFLIRKIMDVVHYHHETGRHNKLTMSKRR
ncbi:MAG: ATP-binding protein [Planctomycetota bacterium]